MVKKNCFSLFSQSPKETAEIGAALADWLIKKNQPAVLILSGDLGAGKTVFVKGLAKELGVRQTVLSPSFVLLRSYRGAAGWKLNHLDAYRLSPKDAKIFDREKFKEPKTITAIEWPEKIHNFFSKTSYRIKIQHESPEIRILELPITIQKHVTRFINRRK